MSTSTTTEQSLLLLQHPSHDHPLELLDLSNEWPQQCLLCHRKISTEAYTCQEGCDTGRPYYHRACVEAPPQIDRHPLHLKHPLTLDHRRFSFKCNACDDEHFEFCSSSFRCIECDFDLDICCALSTVSDEGGFQGSKTSEQITLPLHPHMLTSFSTRHDFVWGRDCYICQGSVAGDGYMCLRLPCKFVIHKRCIQDLYYADGTKAPRVYHGHPLEVFVGEDTGSRTCAGCGSNKSGEFIGCASCDAFYHRHCFQVPEILQYPSHNPDHTLVLFPDIHTQRQCESCSRSSKKEIYYRCTSCEFFVHVGCAFQVLSYCEEGMSAKIKLSWHEHPVLLCHTTGYWNVCSYCEEDDSIGPSYLCKEKNCSFLLLVRCTEIESTITHPYCEDDSIGPSYLFEEKYCRFLLHKRCTEIESTITHPHHPDHPLTLCGRDDDDDDRPLCFCKACGDTIYHLKFSCERCIFDLHVRCAVPFPTHKNCLHEHKLLRLEAYMYMNLGCNRCGRFAALPLFRCIPCDFNLHEECMELPQVVESKIHWHPLTLHETFLEDDSGEYYCEHCEETRDPRLGVYVCGQCKLSMPRIYHIECALPEIGKVYEKKSLLPPAVEKLNDRIADKRKEVRTMQEEARTMKEEIRTKKEEIRTMKEEVRTMEEKLEDATGELRELVMERDKLLEGEIEDESEVDLL